MLQELVCLIAGRMKSDAPPPATEADISSLQERALDQLGLRVPEEYIDFLRLIDGCYVSSEQFFATRERPCIRNVQGRLVEAYSIDDLVEFNRCCRIDFDTATDVIVVGDGTLDYFRGWSSRTNDWFLLEQDGSGYRAKTYATFAEMLADSLQDGGIDTRAIMPASFEYFSLDAKGQKVRGARTT